MQVSHVSEAMKNIPDGFALALLDIEVLDGKSYPVARKLMQNDIPFIFISGNERDSLPQDLKHTPFLSKPASVPPAGAAFKVPEQRVQLTALPSPLDSGENGCRCTV